MIETADRASPIGFDVKTVRPYEKIALLRQRMRELEQPKEQLKKAQRLVRNFKRAATHANLQYVINLQAEWAD